jgi:hypothetical protein
LIPLLLLLLLFALQQLSLEDESAPAEVAGLQCHVAYWCVADTVRCTACVLKGASRKPSYVLFVFQSDEGSSSNGSAFVSQKHSSISFRALACCKQTDCSSTAVPAAEVCAVLAA